MVKPCQVNELPLGYREDTSRLLKEIERARPWKLLTSMKQLTAAQNLWFNIGFVPFVFSGLMVWSLRWHEHSHLPMQNIRAPHGAARAAARASFPGSIGEAEGDPSAVGAR